jgi:hypothetical protein
MLFSRSSRLEKLQGNSVGLVLRAPWLTWLACYGKTFP